MNITAEKLFSALAHPTRLRCLILLLRQGELCVCELTLAMDAAQPNISRHLGQLRQAALVLDRREGLWIHYCINPDLPRWVLNVLTETADGVINSPPFADDVAALKILPAKPGLACA
jgi:ArsR family transcriptional regulator